MFRHQGPTRSHRHNEWLAAYLACVGGFVNSCGFVLYGLFSSHVTGNIARFSSELAALRTSPALAAFAMVFCFFVGAFGAGMVVESRMFTKTPTAYGVALSCEALLLSVFGVLTAERAATRAPSLDCALWLCAAMGVQNSLVTRLSGAVVRTTHLTGVVTDMGIELARLLTARPRKLRERGKLRLHATILLTFSAGSLLGALLTLRYAHLAVLAPTIAVAAGALYAFVSARSAPSDHGAAHGSASDALDDQWHA